MSGWQRIGVVISVLWLVGLPVYLVVSSGISAGKRYEQCLEERLPSLTWEEKHDICWKSSHPALTTFTWKDVGYTLIAGNFDTVILWSMMLVPIVIFWLVGSIILVTIRWIRRGFAH